LAAFGKAYFNQTINFLLSVGELNQYKHFYAESLIFNRISSYMNKKTFLLLLLLAISVLAIFFIYKNKSERVNDEKPVAIMVDDPNDSLGIAMQTGLSQYYQLSNALTASDAAKAASVSGVLKNWLDSMPVDQIKTNEGLHQLVTNLVNQSKDAATSIANSTVLEDQRKQFQILSNRLFDMLRSLKYNEATVYEIYCPMALGNTGATWLSPTNDINNPYFGSKMLHCGEVRDSLYKRF